MKFLEIKTSMLLNLDFANNTISSCFLFLFLIIHLYLQIPAVIVKIFNRIVELAIPIGIQSKEAKAEIEIHQKLKSESVKYNLELHKPFCAFYSSIHFAVFFKEIISCFIYIFQFYSFSSHVFKVIIYFQLNQEFFYISIYSSSLNIFSSSFLHLLPKTERTNLFY